MVPNGIPYIVDFHTIPDFNKNFQNLFFSNFVNFYENNKTSMTILHKRIAEEEEWFKAKNLWYLISLIRN